MPFGTPGPYPIPSETIVTTGGVIVGGPPYMKYHRFQPSYDDVTDEHLYEDGGASFVLFNDEAPIIFLFEYDGLDGDQHAILDNHRFDAFGKAFGFEFTDPRSGQVITDVHYLDWTEDHLKTWINSRTVRLIKRPA